MDENSEPTAVHHEEAEKPQRRNARHNAKTDAPSLRKTTGSGPPKETREKEDASGNDERKVIGVEERAAAATKALDE